MDGKVADAETARRQRLGRRLTYDSRAKRGVADLYL